MDDDHHGAPVTGAMKLGKILIGVTFWDGLLFLVSVNERLLIDEEVTDIGFVRLVTGGPDMGVLLMLLEETARDFEPDAPLSGAGWQSVPPIN